MSAMRDELHWHRQLSFAGLLQAEPDLAARSEEILRAEFTPPPRVIICEHPALGRRSERERPRSPAVHRLP